ncbi:hypothetical protein RCL1_008520 [Eukaryota sp. TZLM3-RCL]
MWAPTTLHLYPITSYNILTRDPVPVQDATANDYFSRMSDDVARFGPRLSVEAIFLTHNHGYPHVLLFKSDVPNDFRKYRLPGGKLLPGESEVDGLKRKLSTKLDPHGVVDWDVGEIVATYYRPEFSPQLVPFIPPSVSTPKEKVLVFVVQLPPKAEFFQAKNHKLVAIPLDELYDRSSEYGKYLAEIPIYLSRVNLVLS